MHYQITQVMKEQNSLLNQEPASYQAVHMALLAGMLSHIGLKDQEKNDYQGARNARFHIFPGSGLFKKTA